MGQSLDSYLVYGYNWDPEEFTCRQIFTGVDDTDYDADEFEWVDYILREQGVRNPMDDYNWDRYTEVNYDSYKEGNAEALKVWDDAEEALFKEYPGVEFETMYVHEYPQCRLLATKDARFYSDYGAKLISPAELAEKAAPAAAALLKFITDFNIDVSSAEGPGWFLTGSYG